MLQVKIDESFFSGKRKYHRGRLVAGVPEPWVLGLLDTTTYKVVMLALPDRSAATLIPRIQQYVAPRTTIVTDGWAGYNGLGATPEQYTHMVVNHQENFVDPRTQAHTQEIEGFWAHAKAKYKSARGFHRNVRPAYLDEMQWRWNHRDTPCLPRLMQLIHNQNNPLSFQDNLPLDVMARKPEAAFPQ